jgi:hypothetical protein
MHSVVLADAPDRLVYETDVSGIWQVHGVDRTTGTAFQVSDHPVGVMVGYPTLDGSQVLYWQEDTGDETGRWLARAWEGGGTEAFLEGVPVGWSEGITQAPGIVVAGISDRGGFAVHAIVDARPPAVIARSDAWLAVAGGAEAEVSDLAGLSADGRFLALQHAEHGDLTHPSLRIVDPRSGEVVQERGDGSSAVLACAWSPIEGDHRLAVAHEPDDRTVPAVWDVGTRSWRDLRTELPGDVTPVEVPTTFPQ